MTLKSTTTTTSQLGDVMTRLEERERKSRFRTFLYTIVPTILAAVLVVSYISWTNAKELQLRQEVELRKESERNAELLRLNAEAKSQADQRAELQKQVQGLFDGPVQAYVRPGQFGSNLIVAKNFEEARMEVDKYLASDVASIRTAEIARVTDSICNLIRDSKDLAAVHGQLDKLVLLLGQACGRAWEKDSQKLPRNTTLAFNAALYNHAIDVTKQLAAARHFRDTEELRDRFWRLYWAELPLIETIEVSGAMVRFGNALKLWTDGEQPGMPDLVSLAHDVEMATQAALTEQRQGQ